MNDHHPHHTAATRSSQRPPTKPMLRLLRELALERGETFTYPTTFGEAQAQINRLKRRRRMRRDDRRREDLAVSRQMATGSGGASAVDHDHETRGWGSSARWA